MKKYLLATLCVTTFSLDAGCTLGPNGINQWRLVYEVGQCLDACCSTIEKTLTALDLGFLTLVDFAALTLVEPLVSILESCDLCSHFEFIISQLDVLDSASDICCAYLSTQDIIIKSDIDSVSTKTDSIGSQISFLNSDLDACCKSLSASDLACCAYLSVQDVIIKSDIDAVSSALNSCCAYLSTQDVIIKSDIDSVSTKTDSVGSQISFLNSDLDACCKSLSTLDVIIKSDLDACCSTMSSVLNQLDTCLLGTVITQAMVPYTISAPGLYTVCQDLSASGANTAITISSNNVDLNLNGHTISSISLTNSVISMSSISDVRMFDGNISSVAPIAVSISGCTLVQIGGVDVISSAPTAFDIQNSTNITLERINCSGSASGSGAVINIGGTSDGIFLKSCTVFDARPDAFRANVTPTVYGISFEDCHALHSVNPTSGIGFSVTINGFNIIPLLFKDCTVQLCGYGFIVDNGTSVQFENCETSECLHAGFDFISCRDFVVDACNALEGGASAFICDGCNQGVLDSNNGISGAGSGVLLNSCVDICMDSCIMQDFQFNGYEIDASPRITAKNCVAQDCGFSTSTGGYYVGSASDSTLFVDCIAQANSTGFNILANNAVLEECAVTQNTTGVKIYTGALNTELLMTCPVNNTTNISDSGTNTMNVSECTISDCCSRVESVVDQLDTCLVGTAITQAMVPYTITQPGLYTVCQDLSVSGGVSPAIAISGVSGVALNLNGYQVASTSGTANAMSLTSAHDVTIYNGAVSATADTAVTVTLCSQVIFSDIAATASNPTAFDIEDCFNVTLERINCANSTGSTNAVINVGGTSDAIFFKSCTVLDSKVNAFTVNVNPGGNGHGIFFEDCHALRTNGSPFTAIGFSVTTSGNDTPVYFTDCTTKFYAFGFVISSTTGVLFKGCSVTSGLTIGYNLITCVDFVMEDCSASGISTGFQFDGSNHGTVYTSKALDGFGFGYLLNTCVDMLLQYCDAQDYHSAGFQLAVTQAVLDTCTAMNSGTGVSITTNSVATVRRCEVDSNVTGISAHSTTSSTDIIIKDCMVAHNTVNGIVDNGTPIWILDTRSINPGPDSIAASTGAGTVITY
jgi:hypothetical protein